jgi:hypothetical protein
LVARKFLLSLAAPLSIACVTAAAGAGACMTVAGGGGAAGAGAVGAVAGPVDPGVSVVVDGCCALELTIPLIESANALANSNDMFNCLMCYLPGTLYAQCRSFRRPGHCLKLR